MNGFLDRFSRAGAVDLLAFLGQWPDRPALSADNAQLSAMADRHGLRAVCVSHLASVTGHDTRSGNELLFHAIRGDERLWPFPVLNPTEPAWEKELEWAVAGGARGIRLVPGYHGYGLRDAGVGELAAAVRERKLPLQVVARMQDERLQHRLLDVPAVEPHELAELMLALDGHPLLISGLRDGERETAMRLAGRGGILPHVLFDLWFCNGPLAVIASLCRAGLAGVYGYSSCTPLQTAEATALQLAAGAIGDDELHDLCAGNALRLLGPAAIRSN
ncbi:amidohydrolase family protein [Cohnella hashimotonis]|uniref:Amidohydrolase family protein n=1 Tax=Cohnella hashimotonis TaxID=2826895 RepID=A0ABT6T9L7_9BACL|nr:amidohydrolase family protein [Cohnella hashimotonis]MDI4643454.1 amidohydrolase family protein [Cohnella hashimotonis]